MVDNLVLLREENVFFGFTVTLNFEMGKWFFFLALVQSRRIICSLFQGLFLGYGHGDNRLIF